MNHRLMNWVKPFATFVLALAILTGWIFLGSRYDWAFLAHTGVLVYFLFFLLIVEAASQADPGQVASPTGNFLAKYPKRRDRVVMLVACIIAWMIPSFASMLKGGRLLPTILLAVGTIAIPYGICLAFGSQELKDSFIPRLIRKKFQNKPLDKTKLN